MGVGGADFRADLRPHVEFSCVFVFVRGNWRVLIT